MPTVSVLIPAYQAERYIAEAIESVLAQTFGDLEVIVVDDCSSDNTYDIALMYRQTDPRVRVERNSSNVGMAANWNRCLDYATGTYVIKLDADDAFLPQILEREVAVLDGQPDTGLVCTHLICVNEEGEIGGTEWGEIPPWFKQDAVVDGLTILDRIIRKGNFICSSSVLLRRSIFEQFGRFDTAIPYTTDMEMWLRAACHYGMACVAEPLVRYRVHGTSITTGVHHSHVGEWYTYNALVHVLDYYKAHGRIKEDDYLHKRQQVLEWMAGQYIEQLGSLSEDLTQVRDTSHAAIIERDVQLQKDATDIALLQASMVARDAQIQKDATDIALLQASMVARDAQLAKDQTDITGLQAAIVARDAQLAKDQTDITGLQAAIVARDAQLAKDQTDITGLQAAIVARDAQLAKDQTDITGLQAAIVARDAQLAKDQTDITGLQAAIVARDAQLAKDQTDITGLQAAIVARDAQLAKDQTDIAGLQAAIVARDAQLAKDQTDIAGLQAETVQLYEQLQQLQQRADSVAAQLSYLQAEWAQLQSSVGWQVLTRVWKFRQRVLPPEGQVSKGLRLAKRVATTWQQRRTRAGSELEAQGGEQREQPPHSGSEQQMAQGDPGMPANQLDPYQQWIAQYEPDVGELHRQTIKARQLRYRPLLSVLTAVHNPSPEHVEAMIESLLGQTYDQWEVWFTRSDAELAETSAVFDRYTQQDSRIHALTLPQTEEGIDSIREGLRKAQGEFVVFVDCGDLLAPFALFEVVKRLNDQPHVDLVYSDNDFVAGAGQRYQPVFKPDWSPAMLLSWNYVAHVCVARTSLLCESGEFLPDSDSAWHWDLVLRVSERTEAVAHIPKILYHRRNAARAGTLTGPTPKVGDAELDALSRHLRGQDPDVQVRLDAAGNVRIIWPLRRRPLVSIIIPSRNPQMVQHCIDSLVGRTSYQEFELILIDTSPGAKIAAQYGEDQNARIHAVVYKQPFNYSAVNNLAARHAHGEVLLFLNDDTEVIDAEWLEEMVSWIARDRIGIVGAKLLRSDERIQHAGVVVGLGGFAGHPFDGCSEGTHTIYGDAEWYRNYSAITGACLMIRRDLFERVGGFDERFVLCGSDVELCLRVCKAGYQVLYNPFARLYHLESATRGTDIPVRDFALSYAHYQPLLVKGDPYYNPNLSLWSTIPRFRRVDDVAAIDHVRHSLRQLGLEAEVVTLTSD